MAITNATRLSDFAAGIGTEGAILKVDNANQRIGIGTQLPNQMLTVAGIVSATQYIGDGSLLGGIKSAGLGTAVGDSNTVEEVIYYTDDLLTVTETTTVNPPASASAAYTQYRDVKLEDSVDLIIETGDDFIPDILGFGDDISDANAAGNGVFDEVYAGVIKNKDGLGAPAFANGLTSVGVITATGGFSGNVTGNATGILNNSANVTIASDESDAVSNSSIIFKTDGTEKVRIVNSASSGGVGISTGNIDPDGNKLLIRGASTIGTNKGHIMLTGDSSVVGEGPQIVFSESGPGANWAGAYIGHTRQGGGSVGDLRFGTRAAVGDANTAPTERLRISNTGAFGIGGANYGTAGQVLTSGGGSAAPSWTTPAGGGWVPLESTTATSGSVAYESTNIFSNNTTYKQFRIEFYIRLTGLGNIKMTQYDGSAWATQYNWTNRISNSNSNAFTHSTSGGTEPEIPISNDSNYGFQGNVSVWNPNLTDVQATWIVESKGWYGFQNWSPSYDPGNHQMDFCTTIGERDIGSGSPVAVGGIKIFPVGTISASYVTVYGLKSA